MTRVQCAELCGIGHARMRADVRVVAPADFQAWAAEQAGAAAAAPAGALPETPTRARAVVP